MCVAGLFEFIRQKTGCVKEMWARVCHRSNLGPVPQPFVTPFAFCVLIVRTNSCFPCVTEIKEAYKAYIVATSARTS